MPDSNYNIGVSTSNAQQQVKGLLDQVNALNHGFGKLKEAVVGIASVAFIQNLLAMADGLSDAAKAAGVSTETLMGFSRAVSANGGEMEKAMASMARFSQTIAEAADGGKGAQDAFLKVGISLQDLANLDEEDLLKKTVKGIAAIDDPSKRAAAGVAAFGKAAKGVDWRGVADDIDKYVASSREAAKAADVAGEVSDMLAGTYKDFQQSVLIALKPMAELAQLILKQKDAIGVLIKVLIDVGAAFLVFNKVIPYLTRVGGELAALSIEGWKFGEVLGVVFGKGASVFGGLKNDVGNLKDALFGGAAAGLAGATALERMGLATSALLGIFGRFLGILTVLWAVYDVVNAITKALTGSGIVEWGEKALKAMGIISQTTAEREKSAAADEKKAKANREVVDAMAKEKVALDGIVEAYKRQNEQNNKKFNLETESLGLSLEQKLIKEQQLAAETEYLSQIAKLKDDYNAKSKSGSESDARMLPQISKAMADLTSQYETQRGAIEQNVQARIKNLTATEIEKFKVDQMFTANKRLRDIQDDIAGATMGPLDKELVKIAKDWEEIYLAQIKAKEAELGPGVKLSEEDRQKYKRFAQERAQIESDEAVARFENSRAFSTGWDKAFREYADSANNAAEKASRLFSKFTQGMEDSLVSFFKTGKWGWKDFLSSMVEEMLRSNIRQTMATLLPSFGGGGQSGSIIGSIWNSLSGKASGGPVGANTPYIVGERGPELFVPNSGGSIIPNGGLGTSTIVNYNISAVDAMSFKQMIARDPSFIHAVAMQGARTIPGGR